MRSAVLPQIRAFESKCKLLTQISQHVMALLVGCRKGEASRAAEEPLQAVNPSPFAVILIPQSREKDLRISLRVNSARDLAPSIFNAVRDSSSSRSDRDSSE